MDFYGKSEGRGPDNEEHERMIRKWSASSADHLFLRWYAVFSFMSRVPVLKPFMTRRFLALSFFKFFSNMTISSFNNNIVIFFENVNVID